MANIPIKKYLPYLVAIAVFVVIILAYFNPVLEGKKMKQSDITNWKGMSKEIADYRAKTGKEPLWTNSMFGGMPAYQISVIYKGNLVKYVDTILQLYLPHPAGLVFLYMLGFFILMMVMGIDVWLAIGGSIAFAFCSFFFIIIDVGHESQAHAIGYMAPVLAGIILTYRGKYLLGASLSALFLALELYTNHVQITYYLMIIILIFIISELIFSIYEKRLTGFFKASLFLGIAAILAVGTSTANLWATYEYGKETTRGKTELTTEKSNRTSGLDKDYATDWSYGVGETFTLLIPNARGGASNGSLGTNSAAYKAMINNGIPEQQAKEYSKNMPLYWGTQPGVAGPVYLGAIIIFLFILAMFVAENKYKWWLLSATLLSILLAWGKNFMPLTDLFLLHVPGYNKFRAVSMTLVIAEFTIPFLALLGLNKALSGEINRKLLTKYLLYAAGATAGISLIFALFGSSFFTFVSPTDEQYKSYFPDWLLSAIREDRASLLRSDAFRSFAFIVLAAGLIWGMINEKIKKQYAVPGLILLMLIDTWAVNRRYVNNDSFVRKSVDATPFQPSQADLFIMKDVDPDFRVFNQTVSPFNDASTSYFHKSIGGYHGAKLRRYQELIEHDLTKGNMNVFNMLNTKYFIIPDKANNNQPTMQINMEALGNAWFVDSVKLVNNADEEINALDNFNPAKTAIIDKRFEAFVKGHSINHDSLSTIKLISYEPNELKYQTNSSGEQLAVFSEIYYEKGWNAYLDGQLLPHFRADYVLRAMIVPSGKHTLVFKFEPKVYEIGEKVSLACSSLLLLLVAGSFFIQLRKKSSV
ncbi:MAG: YfhO family protein [Bacteroidetes bacterium]|nr:YfhO family protein [Bacteroidota bacterium]